MLVLRRSEGQWVEVRHRSGDVLRIRVYAIDTTRGGKVQMALDDEPRHFAIERPERVRTVQTSA